MEETRQKAPGNGHFPAVLRFVAALLLSGTLCLAWGGGNLLAQIRSIYVTIDAADASIREVLESIEAQSDLRFIYADEVKPILTKVVTVREKNVSANRILDQILPDVGLQYSVGGTQVRIYQAASGSRDVAQTVSGTVISGTDNSPLAGVMIYVSFVELFQQANTTLSAEWGAHTGVIVTVASFFAGILLIGVIDRLVPSIENPHEAHRVEEMDHQPHNPRLMRMGVMTALAIGIHNFPEGIATFTSAVDNMALGVAIAVAIAIHNIPEGIAVSIPIFYATGDRKKAFKLSLLSGLAEPVGALLAYLVLMPFMSPTLMGCILAGVAGIMVFISIDELLPAAREYGEAHISIYGVVAGMALMAVSLILLA